MLATKTPKFCFCGQLYFVAVLSSFHLVYAAASTKFIILGSPVKNVYETDRSTILLQRRYHFYYMPRRFFSYVPFAYTECILLLFE